MTIFLASKSPRRLELLLQMGMTAEVVCAEVDESAKAHELPADLVSRLAKEKAGAAVEQNAISPSDWVIAGDTLVAVDSHILGKPADFLEAKEMLQKLSGRSHSVFSAVAVAHQGRVEVALNQTKVFFAQLTDEQINAYLATDEAYDKAGAYAIQGEAAKWIEKIDGSYYGVMGLPIFELHRLLSEMKFYPV